ncbi:MAG: adaptor protein MecA [Lachnospiraceae bacterium]
MKIEKVNDNQIRCTLTREDLEVRHIKLSELAYGTEKARMLFHDMMQQASYEFGFEADDIPLMIEAIPVSTDAIVLLISKVEYPDELDTRFSKFSDSSEDAEKSGGRANPIIVEGADDILGLFRKKLQRKTKSESLSESKENSKDSSTEKAADSVAQIPTESELPEDIAIPDDLTRLYRFHSLEQLSRLAQIVSTFYHGSNSLYKNEQTNRYYLILHKNDVTPENFNKVCNILSEYSRQEQVSVGTEAFFEEHYKVICPSDALKILAELF